MGPEINMIETQAKMLLRCSIIAKEREETEAKAAQQKKDKQEHNGQQLQSIQASSHDAQIDLTDVQLDHLWRSVTYQPENGKTLHPEQAFTRSLNAVTSNLQKLQQAIQELRYRNDVEQRNFLIAFIIFWVVFVLILYLFG